MLKSSQEQLDQLLDNHLEIRAVIKAVVFDLDDTLCKIGKGIQKKDISLLKAIEKANVRVIIASGKPTYYLCGFFRQVGLKKPILIGENGGDVQFGISLPPRERFTLPYSEVAKTNVEFFRTAISKACPNLFWQPNRVGLGMFPKDKRETAKITKIIEENRDKLTDVSVFYYSDAIDIIPSEINKYNSLQCLCNKLDIAQDEIIAVGDGANDYPMFNFAKISYGVKIKDETKVTKNFDTINEVLHYILENNI